MNGAILGGIIGGPYEFDRGDKTRDFPLFCEDSESTDDTVMTIAVADAFLPVNLPEVLEQNKALCENADSLPNDHFPFYNTLEHRFREKPVLLWVPA